MQMNFTGVTLLLLLSLVGGNSLYASPNFEIRAHRGGRVDAPENILPAFIQGIKSGSDSIEFDIHFTQDKKIVISHDPFLDRRCKKMNVLKVDSKKPIIEMNIKEIKQFECGSLPDSEFPNQTLYPGARVPILQDALDLLDRKELNFSKSFRYAIEIKIWPDHPEYTPSRSEIAQLLMKSLKTERILKHTTVISFDLGVLVEIKKINSDLSTQLLVGDAAELVRVTEQPESYKTTVDAILPYWELVNSTNLLALKKSGFRVMPWFPNEVTEWKTLLDLGVDGITTDDPRNLKKFLHHYEESK